MRSNLSEKEKYQEATFDFKADKEKFYQVGGRDNRNHIIKFRKILEKLDLKKGESVLEVGTGKGDHALRCLENTDVFYTGIDISQKSLDVASEKIRKFEGRYLLKQDNANDLSFNDGCFDAVFCAATLHHMEKPSLMISEMARVLRPGGRLLIMEPNWIYPSNIGFSIMLKEDRNMWLMRRKNFTKWLKEANLKNINIENLIYTPPVPVFLIPAYDIIDKILSRIPIIRRCSLILIGSAGK